MGERMYFDLFAAAYVRGEAMKAAANGGAIASDDKEIDGRALFLPSELINAPLMSLTPPQLEEILKTGKAAGLKLYRFKDTNDALARVKKTIGVLRAVRPASIVDVGSGRGAFLWPCLNAFPDLRATSVDLLAHRVNMLNAVALGGIDRLSAIQGDIFDCELKSKSADVVTLLEVLEHIPDAAAAVRGAVRIARKHIVATVPSKPDDNPEHIHLFTKSSLGALFEAAGVRKINFDYVPGHMLLAATLED